MGMLIFGFMLLFIACGVFQMAVTVPMIRRRVKPNALYGFRIPKTLGNEAVWYDANAYAGRMLFVSGLSQVIAAVAFAFVPGIGRNLVAYNLICGAVTLTTVLLAAWQSNRYANTL